MVNLQQNVAKQDHTAHFSLQAITLRDSGAIDALYQLYCQNFPLSDEQESEENFRRCLELNDVAAVQAAYGPYHEYYLVIRSWNDERARFDRIVGGLIFGVTSSPQHLSHGFLCSVQAIYLFRQGDPELKEFLYKNKELVESTLVDLARKACWLDRFAHMIGESTATRVAIFFEANNPSRMAPREIQTDKDLSHIHPALRYRMWLIHGARPLDFAYVQPPLSPKQAAVEYLDLFAVESLPGASEADQRLVTEGDATGIPGPVLAEHLRHFFCISVLKGNPEAVVHPDIPVQTRAGTSLEPVDAYCDAIAARPFVPLIPMNDERLKEIRSKAVELSLAVLKQTVAIQIRGVGPDRIIGFWSRMKPWVERASLILALLAAAVWLLKTQLIQISYAEDMDLLRDILEGVIVFFTLLTIVFQLQRWRERNRQVRSHSYLREDLDRIVKQGGRYKDSQFAVVLRDVLEFRAANHFDYDILMRSPPPVQEKEVRILSNFLASRIMRPSLMEIGLSHFDIHSGAEAGKIEHALSQFPMGVMQARYVPTRWHAYYSCLFPVKRRLAEAGVPLESIQNFQYHIDKASADALWKAPAEREAIFSRRQDGGVCLFLSHILDVPPDDDDPGTLFESSAIFFRQELRRPASPLLHKAGLMIRSESEVACGRMLTIASHLAVVMGRLARHRRVSTDLYCDCTILIHLTQQPAIELMRYIGFQDMGIGGSDGRDEDMTGKRGRLLAMTLSPGAESFAKLSATNPTAATFFGLISNIATGQRGRDPLDLPGEA